MIATAVFDDPVLECGGAQGHGLMTGRAEREGDKHLASGGMEENRARRGLEELLDGDLHFAGSVAWRAREWPDGDL